MRVFNDLNMFKREINRLAHKNHWGAGKLYVKIDRKKVWVIDTAHSKEQILALLELNNPIEKDVLIELYKESLGYRSYEEDKSKTWEQRMNEDVIFVKDIKR